MQLSNRRYDIDWIRVIAIGLLLLYHVAIGFQRWGIMIGFITNSDPWDSLWVPMTMLNVWRIPLLFFVSGMGVYFAIQNRNWKELLLERAARIFVPFLAGMLLIVPLHLYIWQRYYNFEADYIPNPGHLWFLGNIMTYVLLFMPLVFYIKANPNSALVRCIKRIFSTLPGLLPFFAVMVAEALFVNPRPFELYATTWHGFFIGLLAFFFGFCFVLSGDEFWKMILKWRWIFVTVAMILFSFRISQTHFPPNYLLAIESNLWILSVLAFGYRYLNKGSRALDYLSQAAYPVYILHMVFLYLSASLVFPLAIDTRLKFVLVLLLTFAGCFAAFELVRRTTFLRPLFGLRVEKQPALKKVAA